MVPISLGPVDGGGGVCLPATVAARDPADSDCLMSYCNVSLRSDWGIGMGMRGGGKSHYNCARPFIYPH